MRKQTQIRKHANTQTLISVARAWPVTTMNFPQYVILIDINGIAVRIIKQSLWLVKKPKNNLYTSHLFMKRLGGLLRLTLRASFFISENAIVHVPLSLLIKKRLWSRLKILLAIITVALHHSMIKKRQNWFPMSTF